MCPEVASHEPEPVASTTTTTLAAAAAAHADALSTSTALKADTAEEARLHATAYPMAWQLTEGCSASPKLLVDKHGPCAACHRPPPSGRLWAMCRGCKSVLYCSKECQRQHWAAHKSICKEYQRLETLPLTAGSQSPNNLFPPSLSFRERSILAQNFVYLQWIFLTDGLRTALFFHERIRHEKPFDPEEMAVDVRLRYNPLNGGNPAKMFRLVAIQFVPKVVTETYFNSPEGDDSKEAEEELDAEWWRKFGKLYRGQLTVIFTAEEIKLRNPAPLLDFTPKEEVFLPRVCAGGNWFQRLSNNIDLGLVCRMSTPGGNQRLLGAMHKEGKLWKWQQLPAEGEQEYLEELHRSQPTLGCAHHPHGMDASGHPVHVEDTGRSVNETGHRTNHRRGKRRA